MSDVRHTHKAVLIEIARYETAVEQIAAWKEATDGALTARKARQRKRANSPCKRKSPPTQVAWSKGRAFFRSLENLSPEELAHEPLRDLIERIHRFVHL